MRSSSVASSPSRYGLPSAAASSSFLAFSLVKQPSVRRPPNVFVVYSQNSQRLHCIGLQSWSSHLSHCCFGCTRYFCVLTSFPWFITEYLLFNVVFPFSVGLTHLQSSASLQGEFFPASNCCKLQHNCDVS